MKKNPRILLTLMCISVWTTLATAGTLEAYAVLDSTSNTLTFKYDSSKPEGAYGIASNKENAPAWSEKSSTIKKVVFESSFAQARPTNCSHWFENFCNLQEIEGIEHLNTSEVTDMATMFSCCDSLKSLDVSHFDTQKVTDMSLMFNGCNKLESLDVSHFDTRKVTDMSNMFNGCYLITSLDVSKFNTQNVTSMYRMFYNCFNLKSIDVSHFDTQKVKDMNGMFCYCSCFKSLDVSSFDTRNVVDMSYMFMNCSFTSLDVSRFDTRNVKDMSHMFDMCLWLKNIDLSKFDTRNVTNMSCMFYYCFNLSAIYVSDNFVTTAVTDDSEMFFNCTELNGAVSFDGGKIGKDRANYVDGYFTKLVATLGGEKIGATGEVLTANTMLAFADDKDFQALEPFRADGVSFSRALPSAGEWSTLCLPFKVDMSGQNFRAFRLLSASATTVTLQGIESEIPAGTPVIIKMDEDAQEISISYTDVPVIRKAEAGSTTEGGAYTLVGVFAKRPFSKSIDNHCFIQRDTYLMNPAKMLEQSAEYKLTLPAYHAYMQETTPSTLDAKMFTLDAGRVPTSIDGITAADTDAKAEYYDLQGRRLSGPQKGLNIVKRGGKAIKIFLE